MVDFLLLLLTILFIGAIIALLRGHLFLFKLIPIPNRKVATFILFGSLFVIFLLPLEDESVETEVQEEQTTTEEKPSENTDSSDSQKETEEQASKVDNSSKENKDEEETEATTSNSSKDNESEKTTSNDQSSDSSTAQKEDDNSSSSAVSSDPNKKKATVNRVVDGDTLEVSMDGKQDSVRLLLVDTPETKHPNKPVQDYGPEASKFAKKKLSGKEVTLEFDGPKRGNYDRLLAYVSVDGKSFNKMLLRQGYARYAYVYNPPYTHAEEFKKAQSKAQEEDLRIWSKENYVTEDGFQSTEPEPEPEPETSTPSNNSLPYDPHGPDRDCGDFNSRSVAQAFFEAAGGPGSDPHRLDGEGDGLVCESL